MEDVIQKKSPKILLAANLAAFTAVHLACIAAFWVHFSWGLVALAIGLYLLRMFGLTAGYHRYFSHRTFKTSRVFQFVLAWIGASSLQKGPLWWAAHHRHHHQHSDQEPDIHSPHQESFWHSHVGWILGSEYEETNFQRIGDFTKYPELRWITKYHHVPPAVLLAVLALAGGWPAVIWGFCISTVITWHITFCINSVSHLVGRRRYATPDDSRNNWFLAILTLGEGWHNNHHYYKASVRQGFYWWEIDVTYYILRGLEALGVVWDLRVPAPEILERNRLDRPDAEAQSAA